MMNYRLTDNTGKIIYRIKTILRQNKKNQFLFSTIFFPPSLRDVLITKFSEEFRVNKI